MRRGRVRTREMRRGMRFRKGMMFGPRMYSMGSFMFFLFGSTFYKMSRDQVTMIH